MDLQDRFTEFVRKNHLFHPGDLLLLAVSGGVDSVVLCELCDRAGFKFVIAHCNFRLRQEESERDSKFVRELAKHYRVEFLLKEFDTNQYAAEHKLSIQEAARVLRYDWFRELIGNYDLPQVSPGSRLRTADSQLILTAHHADDNIETMLMNFFRGTGIQGLRGILPKQEKLVRPLLLFRKAELVEFATSVGLQWVEDSSNETEKYSRNYFRKNIIPALKTIYPEVERNLLHNLQRFQDIEKLYYQAIDAQLKKLLKLKGNEIHIPVLQLKKSEPLFSIVYEIIKTYNFTPGQVQDVIKLTETETGKYIQSSTHRIIKNRNWLIITPISTNEAQNIVIEESDTIIHFTPGTLRLQKHASLKDLPVSFTKTGLPAAAEKSKNDKRATGRLKYQVPENGADTALVNAEQVIYPLLLRRGKTGDYFYPLGMGRKKKKLSRFLIDQKLSKSDKENVWVIEMNKKIIWVVGMRIDERFKVIGESGPVLSITLERQQIG